MCPEGLKHKDYQGLMVDKSAPRQEAYEATLRGTMSELLGLWGKETQHFHLLSPDHVMAAVEGLGKRLTGGSWHSIALRIEFMMLSLLVQSTLGKVLRPQMWL